MNLSDLTFKVHLEHEGSLYTLNIPTKLVEELQWEENDSIQITVNERGQILLQNLTTKIQDTLASDKERVIKSVTKILNMGLGYSLRTIRPLSTMEGYEITLDKPNKINYPEYRNILDEISSLAKKEKIHIEVV